MSKRATRSFGVTLFAEGLETRDLKRTKALLDELPRRDGPLEERANSTSSVGLLPVTMPVSLQGSR